jgi:hypothetical protein
MLNKEPALIINGLSGLLQQILPLLVVVGLLNLTSDKLAGWVSIIGLVMTFISTALIRQNVVSPDTANKQIQEGIDSPKGSTTVQEVINKVEEKRNET